MRSGKPRIAFWFRYGPAEHAELFHALPTLIEALAASTELHYFGMRTSKPVPQRIRDHATIHTVPFTVNRKSSLDKALKMALWYLCIPWMGLRCRLMGIRLVYIDDYLPLGALLARIFFGRNVAVMVGDFLHNAYAERMPVLKPLAAAVNFLDMAVWRRLPVVFTHVESAKAYLVKKGVPSGNVISFYDPCDMTLYHPLPRDQARAVWHYSDTEVVLVHHGILHPIKAIDRILGWIAPIMAERPGLRMLIVGTGSELDRLKELARELKVEQAVCFTGWLATPADVNVALNAADIGLVMRMGDASDDFHVTGALVHSMAAGLPILSAKLNGVMEIVKEGESGFLFAADNGAEFREKLLKMIDSRELREQCGRQALALALRHFNMQDVVRTIVEPMLKLAECRND